MNCPICHKPMINYNYNNYDCYDNQENHLVSFRHELLWWMADFNLLLEIGHYTKSTPTIVSTLDKFFTTKKDVDNSNTSFEEAYPYLLKFHKLMVFL